MPRVTTKDSLENDTALLFAKELAENMRATTTAIQGFSTELHNHALLLNSLREQFSSVKQTVENLAEIVQGQRGGRSLTTRIELMQSEIESVQEWIEDQKANSAEQKKLYEEQKREKDEQKKEKEAARKEREEARKERLKLAAEAAKEKWKSWTAIALAILGLIGTVLGYILKR
jgi:chromosome segregation ATPase